MSKIYFIATMHPEFATDDYPEGSIVIDPWRYVPDQKGVSVKRIGENKPELISILVPSRGRVGGLTRLVLSAYDNATFPKRLEFVVRLDDDDHFEKDYRKLHPDWGVRFIVGPRILLSAAWNECYDQAKGEIFMHCGDDIVFKTPGWDQIVRDEFAKSEDKILLVHGDDCSPNTDALATHGFVHRRWVETVGYFLPPLFSSDWNDVWLTEVADEIGRRVKVPIVTEHMHYSFGKAEYDLTHQEREQRGAADNVVELFKKTKPERISDAEKLKAVMT